jgi:plastocyanin
VRKMIALAFVAGLVLAACSSDDGGGTTTGSATTGGATGGNCSDVSSGADFHVTMKDFEFDPSCIIAKNTQKLDLENLGNTTHTFTIDGTPIDVELDAGKSQELDAPGDALPPGDYTFYCRFHGSPDGTGMAGKITVS